MSRRRTLEPLVDLDAIERDVRRRQQAEQREQREQNARASQLGIEAAVLGAMITRYEFELFADLEEEDFAHLPHRHVFAALRALELRGADVDGEFLLDDIATELDRRDREEERHVRDSVTDQVLAALVSPPRQVVPIREGDAVRAALSVLRDTRECRRPTAAETSEALAELAARRRST